MTNKKKSSFVHFFGGVFVYSLSVSILFLIFYICLFWFFQFDSIKEIQEKVQGLLLPDQFLCLTSLYEQKIFAFPSSCKLCFPTSIPTKYVRDFPKYVYHYIDGRVVYEMKNYANFHFL